MEIARLLSDDRLARRAAAGDERALAAIFDRYHQDLYRFSLAIVGNPADAQDALQNTMVKVLRALPGEERQIELKPWLYRIAHNESIELLRRRRPAEQLDPELASRGGSLAEDAESRARLRRLIADLEQLPERQRGALVMRELGGLEFEEIGAALGTSAATARQTLYEARQSLRQMDEGREMDCDAVTRALSDADGRVTRRRDIRAHLRTCPGCRRFREEIEARRGELGALAPLPVVAATGLLQGVLGGAATSGGTGAGAGLAGVAAGGAAKSLGAGAAIKSAAAVAAVAAVGVGAADRSGVVDVTPWGAGSQTHQESEGRIEPGGSPAGAGGAGADGADPASGAPTSKSGEAQGQGAREGNRAPQQAAEGPGSPASAGPGRGPQAGPGGSPPRGRGHEKQHPEAASHGQQTAAGHKSAGSGGGQGQARSEKGRSSKPAKSAKPDKPIAPSKPSQATQPPLPEQSDEGKVNASPKAPSGPAAATQPPPNPSPQGEAKGNPHASQGAVLAE